MGRWFAVSPGGERASRSIDTFLRAAVPIAVGQYVEAIDWMIENWNSEDYRGALRPGDIKRIVRLLAQRSSGGFDHRRAEEERERALDPELAEAECKRLEGVPLSKDRSKRYWQLRFRVMLERKAGRRTDTPEENPAPRLDEWDGEPW